MKITIARQCGSGGHEIAEALAEKLHLEIFDKKRFVEEAKKRNGKALVAEVGAGTGCISISIAKYTNAVCRCTDIKA